MNLRSEPLVSVITPVYNGEKYLAECIESVLSQTYDNWEYVIVNNCSTDSTLEIAECYAKRDARIKIYNNTKFLGLLDNWNHALRQITSQSKYCKIVHADDRLFPECISRMVEMAETHPSIGVVGAYRMIGKKVYGHEISYPESVLTGREACRRSFIERLRVFGSPTSTMLRSEDIGSRDEFYNVQNIHADREVIFELLRNWDFGFVHQILTYTRVHDDTVSTTYADRMNTYIGGELELVKKFGPVYLSETEYNQCLKDVLGRYYRFLSKNLFQFRNKGFWGYHRSLLKRHGYGLSPYRFLTPILMLIAKAFLHPKDAIYKIISGIRRTSSS